MYPTVLNDVTCPDIDPSPHPTQTKKREPRPQNRGMAHVTTANDVMNGVRK